MTTFDMGRHIPRFDKLLAEPTTRQPAPEPTSSTSARDDTTAPLGDDTIRPEPTTPMALTTTRRLVGDDYPHEAYGVSPLGHLFDLWLREQVYRIYSEILAASLFGEPWLVEHRPSGRVYVGSRPLDAAPPVDDSPATSEEGHGADV